MHKPRRPRTPRYWPRMKAVIIGVRDGLDRAIVTILTRFIENLTVDLNWHRPVTKIDFEVSGDALARHRFEEMPLPNIWNTKEDHGSN